MEVDSIKERLTQIFNNRVGNKISHKKKKEMLTEANFRYKNKIPPGYKDYKSNEKNNSFGDFIIWKSIMEKSIESNKPIIFITDDRKEDWWEKFNGKVIGPRYEIIAEFVEVTKNKFYMYRADHFLTQANKFLEKSINKDTIEEVKRIRVGKEEKFSSITDAIIRAENKFNLEYYKFQQLIEGEDVNNYPEDVKEAINELQKIKIAFKDPHQRGQLYRMGVEYLKIVEIYIEHYVKIIEKYISN